MSLQNKKNLYTCEKCGFRFVTIDRDEGTTPFMTACRHPTCGGMAHSAFYSVDQSMEPTHEWYAPDSAEMATERRPGVLQHVAMGGLLLRPIAPFPAA